jgi:hypothetical protein
MQTPISKILDYLETVDFDHDLLDAAIVGMTDVEVIKRILTDHLKEEMEQIRSAYDAGTSDWAKDGQDYFDLIYGSDEDGIV